MAFGANGVTQETFVGDDSRYHLRRRDVAEEFTCGEGMQKKSSLSLTTLRFYYFGIDMSMSFLFEILICRIRDEVRIKSGAARRNCSQEKPVQGKEGLECEEDDRVHHYASSRIVGASEATARLLGRSHVGWTLQPTVKKN